MKARVLIVATLWVALISGLHVHFNVGWKRLIAQLGGRRELIVGFLPVT